MSTIDQTFPAFVQACADLYRLFLPWAFILLLLAFIFEFWAAPPSPFGLMKFIIRLFLVVLLVANSNSFINTGQTLVQQWVQQNIPAQPANVAARYQQQLAAAQGAPAGNQSFWSTLFSSNWFEAIVYAFLTLVAWLAMALMYFVYGVQRALLLVCWAVSPLLFPLLAIQPLSHLGLRHVLRILAIMLWPVGLALAATWTDGLIGVAVNQNFLASQSVAGSLGYGLQNLLAVTVIALWIIFSTIFAPAMISKVLVGSPGAATVISRSAEVLVSIGLPGVAGAATHLWQRFSPAASTPSASSAGAAGEFTPGAIPSSGNPPSSPAPPAPGDPTGDQQVRDILKKLGKE